MRHMTQASDGDWRWLTPTIAKLILGVRLLQWAVLFFIWYGVVKHGPGVQEAMQAHPAIAAVSFGAVYLAMTILASPPPWQRLVDAANDVAWGTWDAPRLRVHAWRDWLRDAVRNAAQLSACMVAGVVITSLLAMLSHGGNPMLPDHGQGVVWGGGCGPIGGGR